MKSTARAKPQGQQPGPGRLGSSHGNKPAQPTDAAAKSAERPRAMASAIAKAPAKVAPEAPAAKAPLSAKPVAKPAEASKPGLAEAQSPAPMMPKPEASKPDAALATQSSPVPPTGPMPMRRDAHPSIPQRQPSKQVEFKAGDHVVYPTHGVGTVQGIETMSAAGHSLQVIVVTFDENRMTLRVPVGKAASSGLRKLAGPESMKEALDTLKGRARIKRTMWSRRAQEYEAKINSGDPIAIAEVVRDLHRNAGQPDQSFSERQIYEQAMDRLAAELAAIDRTDKAQATIKLLEHLKAA